MIKGICNTCTYALYTGLLLVFITKTYTMNTNGDNKQISTHAPEIACRRICVLMKHIEPENMAYNLSENNFDMEYMKKIINTILIAGFTSYASMHGMQSESSSLQLALQDKKFSALHASWQAQPSLEKCEALIGYCVQQRDSAFQDLISANYAEQEKQKVADAVAMWDNVSTECEKHKYLDHFLDEWYEIDSSQEEAKEKQQRLHNVTQEFFTTANSINDTFNLIIRQKTNTKSTNHNGLLTDLRRACQQIKMITTSKNATRQKEVNAIFFEMDNNQHYSLENMKGYQARFLAVVDATKEMTEGSLEESNVLLAQNNIPLTCREMRDSKFSTKQDRENAARLIALHKQQSTIPTTTFVFQKSTTPNICTSTATSQYNERPEIQKALQSQNEVKQQMSLTGPIDSPNEFKRAVQFLADNIEKYNSSDGLPTCMLHEKMLDELTTIEQCNTECEKLDAYQQFQSLDLSSCIPHIIEHQVNQQKHQPSNGMSINSSLIRGRSFTKIKRNESIQRAIWLSILKKNIFASKTEQNNILPTINEWHKAFDELTKYVNQNKNSLDATFKQNLQAINFIPTLECIHKIDPNQSKKYSEQLSNHNQSCKHFSEWIDNKEWLFLLTLSNISKPYVRETTYNTQPGQLFNSSNIKTDFPKSSFPTALECLHTHVIQNKNPLFINYACNINGRNAESIKETLTNFLHEQEIIKKYLPMCNELTKYNPAFDVFSNTVDELSKIEFPNTNVYALTTIEKSSVLLSRIAKIIDPNNKNAYKKFQELDLSYLTRHWGQITRSEMHDKLFAHNPTLHKNYQSLRSKLKQAKQEKNDVDQMAAYQSIKELKGPENQHLLDHFDKQSLLMSEEEESKFYKRLRDEIDILPNIDHEERWAIFKMTQKPYLLKSANIESEFNKYIAAGNLALYQHLQEAQDKKLLPSGIESQFNEFKEQHSDTYSAVYKEKQEKLKEKMPPKPKTWSWFSWLNPSNWFSSASNKTTPITRKEPVKESGWLTWSNLFSWIW